MLSGLEKQKVALKTKKGNLIMLSSADENK
jgi:hypothetical protein